MEIEEEDKSIEEGDIKLNENNNEENKNNNNNGNINVEEIFLSGIIKGENRKYDNKNGNKRNHEVQCCLIV